MRYSGLYFIANPGTSLDASLNSVNALVNGIESHFQFATRQTPWSLLHRLLRSVPAPPPKAGDDRPGSPGLPTPPSYQHILGLSYLSQSRTYCYIHTPPPSQSSQNPAVKIEPVSRATTPQPSQTIAPSPTSPGSMIAIPTKQAESHITLLANTFSPLWTFRQALQIPNGITYNIGQFTVNIGDLRAQRAGPQSSGVLSPGAVCCITTLAGAGNDEDGDSPNDSGYTSFDGGSQDDEVAELDDAENLIRELWNTIREGIDFGRAEVKEVMMGKEGLKGEGQDEAVVRMWCEVLRLRG